MCTKTNNVKNLNEEKWSKREVDKFYKFLETDAELRNSIPKKYLKTTTQSLNSYLINREGAKKFVSLIKDDLLQNLTNVVEVNPGLGLLTKELLKAGVPFINLYEKDSVFYNQLEKLSNTFPDRVTVTNGDLIHLMTAPVSYSVHNSIAMSMLKVIEKRKWEEVSCLQIIGTIFNNQFIRNIILNTVFQRSFMMYGRVTFYIAVPSFIWFEWVAPADLNSVTVMLKTLFNYKHFGNLDNQMFVPWLRPKRALSKKLAGKLSTEDMNAIYILKLEPKPDLYKAFNGEELVYFWHFVRNNFYKPHIRVIPSLEKIMPGCGINLIAKDYTIFTEFTELNLKQIYDLFCEFKSWPEFKNSVFISSIHECEKLST
ncbi:mitochondrial transcription factor B2 isoform X2 [Calliopsis andreniformis]